MRKTLATLVLAAAVLTSVGLLTRDGTGVQVADRTFINGAGVQVADRLFINGAGVQVASRGFISGAGLQVT